MDEYEDHGHKTERNHASYGGHGSDNGSRTTCVDPFTSVNDAVYWFQPNKQV